ncbi:hypothetical protein NRA58_06300 [Acinetobacter baumannii]|nr:hypothetical protein [Acinetobacter baumannii]
MTIDDVLKINKDQLDRLSFKRHCHALSLGVEIPISRKGKIVYISTYEELQREFNLPNDFKQKVKLAYNL